MKALIVEDDPLLSKIFIRYFSLREWAADAGFSVPEARALFQAGRYDLVLCDVELPGGDGVSLAQELLRTQPSLRVIMTSGRQISLARARKAGLAACLPKPFSSEELRAMIVQQEISLKKAERPGASRTAARSPLTGRLKAPKGSRCSANTPEISAGEIQIRAVKNDR